MITIDGTTYELRSWESDSPLMVRVQTSPGKFEGQAIWAQHLYAAAGEEIAGGDIYDALAERVVATCFTAPPTFDLGDPQPPQLTEDEVKLLARYAGALMYESEFGFVSVELFDTKEAYIAEVGRLEDEYADEESADDEGDES